MSLFDFFKCCPEFESNKHNHVCDKHTDKLSMSVRPSICPICEVYIFTFETTWLIRWTYQCKLHSEIHFHSGGSIVNPSLNEAHNEFCQFSQSCSL